jgi:tungstate transport system substrate-binding protein
MTIKFVLKIQILVLLLLIVTFGTVIAEDTIICASTTSTQNAGLFDHILPLFEKKTGIHVRVIATGTGAALEISKRGDADVVVVHSKEDELRMVKEGWFVNRHDFMFNDFIVIGPSSDPAGGKKLRHASELFKAVASGGALFISRGDNSGTHKKELRLWNGAGIIPNGKSWYFEVGQGMAKTIRIAAEKRAYALTDRGTYLSLKDKERLDLQIILEKDPALFNQYGVMAVNPEKHPHVKYIEAMNFINWVISTEGQEAIASFEDTRGNQLFYPNAPLKTVIGH